MKRAKLEAVLRRKWRLKITNRKRGRFVVRFNGSTSEVFPNKRQAMTWLYTTLRCLPVREISIEVVKGGQ